MIIISMNDATPHNTQAYAVLKAELKQLLTTLEETKSQPGGS